MKIVHIVRQFSPSIGGLEASVLNLADAQRRRHGIDARVVTLNRMFGHAEILPPTAVVAAIPVRRLPWRGSMRYPFAPAILCHLQQADVVHVHAIDFFFDFLALAWPLHRRKMIASTHGGFFHSAHLRSIKKIWFATATRLSILAYHRIVACSYSDAEMFRGIAGERLVVIENGIDQARFSDAAARRQTRTIVYFGRFAPHKQIAKLFPLLRLLLKLNPEWRLLVAGRPADQSAAELQTMALTEGVSAEVRFVVNPQDADLRALLAEASYFACLSSYEGFGLAAVEAMSAGLFPILSDIGPFRRLVEQAKLGLLVDADALASTAAAIEASVLDDPAGYCERQKKIRKTVRRYDWDSVAAEYIQLYEDAAGKPPTAALALRMVSDA